MKVLSKCLKMFGHLGRGQVAVTDELTLHCPIHSMFGVLCHMQGCCHKEPGSCKHCSFCYSRSIFWAHFSHVMGVRKLWWIWLATGHQTMATVFCECKFSFGAVVWICFLVQPLSIQLLCTVHPSSNECEGEMMSCWVEWEIVTIQDDFFLQSAHGMPTCKTMALLQALLLVKRFRNLHINISDMFTPNPVGQIENKHDQLYLVSYFFGCSRQ